jgi:hypothetical protein
MPARVKPQAADETKHERASRRAAAPEQTTQPHPVDPANPWQDTVADLPVVLRTADMKALQRTLGNRRSSAGWRLSRSARHRAQPASKVLREALPAPKRTLDTLQREHLFQGSYRKSVLSGYHSIRGAGAIAEGFGPKTGLGNGFYQQSVRPKKDPSVTKAKPSTFYPDDWTEQEIIEAIEYASEIKRSDVVLYEVMRPAKCKGTMLFRNEEGVSPYFS